MKVAIVNDSPLATEALRRVVRAVPGAEVAWTAADGVEAVDLAAADRPDALLMDLIMPRMDGVEATRLIMRSSPCPILVVTATVSGNMDRVYEAMGHGALDAVNTPALGPGGVVNGGEDLVRKLSQLAQLSGRSAIESRSPRLPSQGPTGAPRIGTPIDDLPPMVVIGASTGGPKALAEVLELLPADWLASVVVIQHIDASFAPGLTKWLAGHARLPIRLIGEGDRPVPGTVLVSGTDDHVVLDDLGRLSITPEPVSQPYRPSVDVFFESLAARRVRPGVAVVLTGMGRDGARGLLALRELGWHTIAQDRETCTVWGMPRAAAELGAAIEILPPPRIGPSVIAAIDALAHHR
ncbi:chemotaxis-specific protein-glutamate methyltransferase CheB [Tautonia marina]|uniref:chemotaxis-specific protein-glutamate methyltransferase CheB n=1 Tax=Tautonia marina TaxID=2653855 RepID=UPI001260F522|nr:chemotaxis-specific protein-glutamate methyltransferase CheB [Tautonia marina]